MIALIVTLLVIAAVVFAVDRLIHPIPHGNVVVGIGSGIAVILALIVTAWVLAIIGLVLFVAGYFVYRHNRPVA